MCEEIVEVPALKKGLSQEDQERFDAVRKKAEELGVLDISFGGTKSVDRLECFERTLEVIEANKEVLDLNAGEAEA